MGEGNERDAQIAAKRQEQDRENRKRANHELLKSLQVLWDEYPEWRFGQLVMNLSRGPTESGFEDTWEWKHGAWYERITKRFWEGRRA